ncbi:MAG: hypothetical protein BROFUL_01191 [Candidatus Brocadia fulgida]|uniref:Uncharacterized protein n=1 Tax=Candidatus Brocadia fulgida TaxID=380242 RepID=A0A0M2UYT1_9BACT|nr:MAG: hypothetical protein BROFUL_01191 [Candidatus Brocadia fulgida]
MWGKLDRLEYFHRMLKKHIELVERRVIKGEQIPVEEKVHSLFEPHMEWLYKGKAKQAGGIGAYHSGGKRSMGFSRRASGCRETGGGVEQDISEAQT